MSGNTVTGNAAAPNVVVVLGAIGLQGARGVIRIQNNIVRDNGGAVLVIEESRQEVPEQSQQVLIQNNHFSEGSNPSFIVVSVKAIDSLLFQGNQCMGAAQERVAAVTLLATRANVTGNVVDFGGGATVMDITGLDLVVSTNSVRTSDGALRVAGAPIAPGPVRVIVTSNLTTGISASSTGVLIRASNFPAP